MKDKQYVFKDNSIFTQKIPLKSLNFKKEIKDELENNKVDIENGFLLRKGYESKNLEMDENERTMVDYITTKDIDRSNEIVLPQGIDFSQYEKNKVVLWAHKYDEMPLGRCQWYKFDGRGFKAKTEYAPAAANPRAEQMWQYRKAGFPMGKSIGFIPLEYVDSPDINEKMVKSWGMKMDEVVGVSRVYTKSLLLEYSETPVPANPHCVGLAVKSGLIEEKDLGDFGFEIELIGEQKLDHKPDLDLHTDNIDLDKANQINMNKYQEKSEELTDDKLKELTTIAFFDIKNFYNEDGSLKYKKFADIPNDFSVVIEKHEEDENGDIAKLFFKDKTQTSEVLAKNLDIFEFDNGGFSDNDGKEMVIPLVKDNQGNLVLEQTEIDKIIEEEFKEIDNVQEVEETVLEEKKDLDDKIDESKNSLSEDVGNRAKLLKFFIKYADKEIIDEFAKIISDKDDISIEEILVKSLEQIKLQKKEIQDLKTNVKKEVEDDITIKSVDFVEIELPVNKEIELDFDLVKVKDIFLQNIEKTFGEIDLSDLIDERLKKAKGVIEFED